MGNTFNSIRKFVLLIVVLSSAMMMISCAINEETIEKSLLEKSWTQSYEESTAEEFEVYRPSDYMEFPSSRYRQVFDFKANNECDYLVLAPNDGHYMKNGAWKYEEKTTTLKIFNPDFEVLYEFEVVELNNDLLKLKTINH